MRLSTPLATLLLTAVVALDAQPAPALKIIVLAGEGAVNIIQQQTAVRPLVEVRDRNNLPVAGATVTFSIGGGGSGAAFAGGAQTLSVTTNAVGQAAASGFNALSSGALQIQVQAAYQGQLATAAISQTNFATAAAAAQAGAGTGATTGAAGGAAGGGGGISATTIGIVGAAVGGGALVASQTVLKEEEEAEAFDSYTGSLSGQIALISTASQSSCTRTNSISGTVTIELFEGNATGRASSGTIALTETSVTGQCSANPVTTFSFLRENTPVSGGPSALTFRSVSQLQNTAYTLTFSGSHSGNTITGTISISVASQAATGPDQPNLTGATSFPITLTARP
jgi:hypothetical protein